MSNSLDRVQTVCQGYQQTTLVDKELMVKLCCLNLRLFTANVLNVRGMAGTVIVGMVPSW